MLRNLFKKIGFYENDPEHTMSPEEKFFSNVVGYADIKKLLLKYIVSKDPVLILLSGPPSSLRRSFLWKC